MKGLYRLNVKSPYYCAEDIKGVNLLSSSSVSLVHPFYNEERRFDLQIDLWSCWPVEVKEKVRITIIDDGSPSPVHTWITDSKLKKLAELNINVYRIEKDLMWNTPGALNLGLVTAPNEWVMIMDSDCAFDGDNWKILLAGDYDPNAVYKFPRQRHGTIEDLSNKRFLPCTMFFHKNLVWSLGGFDEGFTGEYSGGYAYFDNDLDSRLTERGHPIYIWNGAVAIEWMPSMANWEIVNRSGSHQKINRRLAGKKARIRRGEEEGEARNTEILRFPWRRVFHSVRGEGYAFS